MTRCSLPSNEYQSIDIGGTAIGQSRWHTYQNRGVSQVLLCFPHDHFGADCGSMGTSGGRVLAFKLLLKTTATPGHGRLGRDRHINAVRNTDPLCQALLTLQAFISLKRSSITIYNALKNIIIMLVVLFRHSKLLYLLDVRPSKCISAGQRWLLAHTKQHKVLNFEMNKSLFPP